MGTHLGCSGPGNETCSVVPSIILQQYKIWTTRAVFPSSFLRELDITDKTLVENSNLAEINVQYLPSLPVLS